MTQLIDKTIYINLNKRLDRKQQIENELNMIGLNGERFEAIEIQHFGILGCGYSHLNVLKMAREQGYKNILILEDDFMFLVSKEEFEKELTEFFNLYPDFDVLMLGYNMFNSEHTPYNNILRVLEAQTASGYIVNEKYYDELINLYEEAMPLLKSTGMHWIYANDQIWKKLQLKDKWYCFSNRIGKQRSGYSDNRNSYVEYDC